MEIEGIEEWYKERLEDTIGQRETKVMKEDNSDVSDFNSNLGRGILWRRRSPRGAFEGNAVAANTCFRCSGSGYLPEYSHVEGGVCFRCRGTGKEPSISSRRYTRGFRF